MKRIYISMISVLVLSLCCKKIQEGFLSDTIRYTSPDLYCQRGLTLVQSAKINVDGSTPPITFEMLNLRDSSGGKLPEAFNTKYSVTVFKTGQSFNVNTDTTIELLNAKRETDTVYPMDFNKNSGQLSFNKASVNIPLGIYNFDVKATNKTGSKTYPSFGTIHVVDPSESDMFTVEDNVDNAADLSGAFTAMRTPSIKFTKVSAEGARIILKITDKNGNAFNPSAGEIIKRGDRPTFENYTRFHPIIYTDTAMICDFEVAPFPLARYVDASTDWGHLIYYRIPETHIVFDNMAAGQYNANPRFAFDINMEGTYIVEFRLPDATRKP